MKSPHWGRSALLLFLAGLALVASCQGQPGTGVTTLKARSLDELRDRLLKNSADIDLFRLRGPFATTLKKDLEIPLSRTERFSSDLYLADPGGKAPLVILLHGYGNSKDDHAYQGLHLATWGLHSLVLSLPNKGPWVRHGITLARIVKLIQARPEILDSRVDPDRIILAGHSFGASAVAVALAESSTAGSATRDGAIGGILLDPAGIGRNIPDYLKKIRLPVLSLGSDERVTLTRNRGYFYQYVHQDIVTVSITNASHEDAQFPLEPLQQVASAESPPDEELQITYVSGLTAAALSLGLTSALDYAWASIGTGVQSNRMFGPMKK